MPLYQMIIWLVGAFSSLCTGLALPSFAIVFGEVVSTYDPRNGGSLDDLMIALLKNILIVAATIWVLGYV